MTSNNNLNVEKNKAEVSKNVPELRFQGFIDAWEQRKLGKVFKTYSGMTPLRSDISNFKNPEVPWIKTTDLKNSDITSNDEKISAKAANKLKVLPVNTVLIAMYGGFNQIGRTGLLTYPATINQTLTALEPNDSISPYFLLTELNYRVNDWKKFAASSRKDPNITKRDIDNFMINFPTQQEQQKVGSFFQQLDKTITLHQRKLDKLKRFKHGYLQQLFPKNGEKVPRVRFANFENEWELHKLEDIIISELKGKAKAEMYGTSSPYLETNYLNGGEVSYVDSPINVDKDDVIILWDGSQAGTVYHGFKGALGSTLKAYSPKGSGEYLYQYLKLNQQVIYDSYRTPNIPHVIKTFTKEFNVHFTCYEEQDKVGSFLNQLDEIIDLYQSKVDKLKLLKKGFLQKMFI